MTRIILPILLLFYSPLLATNYYLSNGGNDSNSGTSPAQAWKTMSKLNASIGQLNPGDSVLFNRGDVFYGEIDLNKSGNSGNPIVFAAYGNGAKPIITGSVQIGNWTKLSGSNIWWAYAPDTVAYLFSNNKRMTLARYPNTGFLTIHAGANNYLQHNGLKGSTNYWDGATVRIRTTRWTYEYREVKSSNTAGRIDFLNNTKYKAAADWGFYLDNKYEELDTPGEWFYDQASNKVFFWAPLNANPNGLNIYGTSALHGITGTVNVKHIHIKNLHFQHQALDAIYFSKSDNQHNYIENCDFTGQGHTGIFVRGLNQNVNNNYFVDILGRAVKGHYVDGGDFTHNVMRRIGMVAGYGQDGNQNMNGFHFTRTENVYIAYNQIDSVGYTGITCYTGHSQVEKNIINWACLRLDDGGGIYAFDTQTHNTEINNNFVSNVMAYPEGTNKPTKRPAHGIYMDLKCAYMDIHDNTLVNAAASGIFINTNANNNVIEDNIIYGPNREGLQLAETNKANVTLDNLFQNNTIYCLKPGVHGVRLLSLYDTEGGMGIFTNNYYINPYWDWTADIGAYWNMRDYTLDEWMYAHPGQSLNDNLSPFKLTGFVQGDDLTGNLVDNSEFDADETSWVYSTGGGVTSGWVANGGLDGGCFQLFMDQGGPTNISTTTTLNGPLVQGEYYRFRFSIISPEYGKVEVLVKNGSNAVVEKIELPFSPNRRDYEKILQLSQNLSTAKFSLRLKQGNGHKIYIDNVEFHQVEVSPENPMDKGQLFKNETDSPSTVSLNGTYYDMEGAPVGSSITLAPYTSRVLFFGDEVEPTNKPKAVMTVTPDNGNAPLDVTFSGVGSSDPDGNITNYLWMFGDGWSSVGQTSNYIYTTPGTYQAMLIVTDNSGLKDTAEHTIVVNSPGGGGGPCSLSADWTHTDIGNVGNAGEVCEDSITGIFDVEASGKQIYGKTDGGVFVHKVLTGDGFISAKINSVSQANAWSMAGVMIREDLSHDSPNILMAMGTQGRWAFQERSVKGQSTNRTTTPVGSVSFPHYVKLERDGDNFMGFESADGINWTLVNSVNIEFEDDIYIGLAISAFSNSINTDAQIEQVEMSQENTFPVEIIHFGAEFVGEDLRLDWVTETELNNDYFTVERSKDGIFFETLNQVQGAGTTQSQQLYSLFDELPYKGVSYYRLKQTDFDGTFTYVSTLRVVNDQTLKPKLSVFPNPTTDGRISLSFQGIAPEELQKLFLMDATGREVAVLPIPGRSFQWNIPADLPPGTYFMVGLYQHGLIRSPIILQ